MIDKNKLTIRDRYIFNILEKEYKNNTFCDFISIEDKKYDYFFSKDYLNHEIDKLCIMNTPLEIVSDKIIRWEIDKVINNTDNGNIIILLDNYFKVKFKILNVKSFFYNHIKKNIGKSGLDIRYYNETKNFTHIFDDEEHYVYEYLKNWDENSIPS